jgi:hypothetical protein
VLQGRRGPGTRKALDLLDTGEMGRGADYPAKSDVYLWGFGRAEGNRTWLLSAVLGKRRADQIETAETARRAR